MHVEHVAAGDREEWNAFVAREPCFSLLQSWEWGEFKERLGWKAVRIAVKQRGDIVAGAQMLVRSLIPGLASVAYIPRGPAGDWLGAEAGDRLLAELHEVARSHRAAFLRIEPPLRNELQFDRILKQRHFRTGPHTNQPRATIILDLDTDLDDILMQMRKKTRQYIRKATREGITVRIGCRDDLPTFCELMRVTSRRERFPHRSRDYYEQEWQIFAERRQAALLMAYHQDRLLAIRTAYYFGRHAAEFHAGSIDHPSTLTPNYLLVWEGIKWARAQGCSTYDLWGIPDEVGRVISEGGDTPKPVRTDGMWGVYQFKRGFGKNIVSYIGAYDYVYLNSLYALASNRVIGAYLDWVTAWMDWVGPS